ncbi:hypothetical protein M422DRAFT_244967 [Sphaerobolus stellatus SS14]|nr:hypothetical protein M422DRAFT_244967 [Sphaerobolus stellatus SS14]
MPYETEADLVAHAKQYAEGNDCCKLYTIPIVDRAWSMLRHEEAQDSLRSINLQENLSISEITHPKVFVLTHWEIFSCQTGNVVARNTIQQTNHPARNKMEPTFLRGLVFPVLESDLGQDVAKGVSGYGLRAQGFNPLHQLWVNRNVVSWTTKRLGESCTPHLVETEVVTSGLITAAGHGGMPLEHFNFLLMTETAWSILTGPASNTSCAIHAAMLNAALNAEAKIRKVYHDMDLLRLVFGLWLKEPSVIQQGNVGIRRLPYKTTHTTRFLARQSGIGKPRPKPRPVGLAAAQEAEKQCKACDVLHCRAALHVDTGRVEGMEEDVEKY